MIKRYRLIEIDGHNPLDPPRRLLDEILNDKTLDVDSKRQFYQDLLYRVKNLPHLRIIDRNVLKTFDELVKNYEKTPNLKQMSEAKPPVDEKYYNEANIAEMDDTQKSYTSYEDESDSDMSTTLSPAIPTPEQPSTDTPLSSPIATKPITRQTVKQTTGQQYIVPVKPRIKPARLPAIPIFRKGKDAYLNPKNPCAFSSVNAIHQFVKHRGITRRRVEEVLENIEAYTKHFPVRSKFPRLQTTSSGIENSIQIDLADVSRHKKYNDGVTFLLVCVDVYSRMFYVEPLKSKKGEEVVVALEKIISKFKSPPIYVYSDFGKEFYNVHVKNYLDSLSIRHCTPKSEIKCAMAERANRTLKSRLAKFMTSKYNWRYVDVLSKVVDGINRSVNRSIKKAPIDVKNGDFSFRRRGRRVRRKYNIGDHVRIYAKQGTFDKGYEERWTQEVFVITHIFPTDPVTYTLADENGEVIDGKFYYHEMIRVFYEQDQVYRIEKIVGYRKHKGKKQVKVRWEGHSAEFDSWVNESEILDIQQ
ncbi:hypothetical protein CRE_23595 [Caenorhabditis remanei]|uniref:Integrase catalytic domain-containing protein n=1 Tax=Caenorhabditis remanei TaxID=31234 RepID=E3MVQ8_CAERE|nr:hypothetical protein CRE_23595 [Caenorhabditis remanei]